MSGAFDRNCHLYGLTKNSDLCNAAFYFCVIAVSVLGPLRLRTKSFWLPAVLGSATEPGKRRSLNLSVRFHRSVIGRRRDGGFIAYRRGTLNNTPGAGEMTHEIDS